MNDTTRRIVTAIAFAAAIVVGFMLPVSVVDSAHAATTKPSHGKGYVVKAGPLAEDEYGWNCWIDGNGYCGERKSREWRKYMKYNPRTKCVTVKADKYRMCKSGRVSQPGHRTVLRVKR